MKKLILFVVIAVFTLNANSQNKPEPIKTLFVEEEQESIDIEVLLGGRFSVISMKDNTHLSAGSYVGALLNYKFFLGAHFTGVITPEKFTALKEDKEVDAKLTVFYGGLYFIHFLNMKYPINFSFPVALGVGYAGVHEDIRIEYPEYIPEMYKYKCPSTHIEGAMLYVVEPGMNINFNFSDTFILSAGVSYKLSLLGERLVNLKQKDLVSDLNINLAFNIIMW